MTYQLRSRGDPVSTESQEQTDTLEENLTEHQVTTPSHVEIISSQLSIIQSVATAKAEANRALTTSDISTKPDAEIHPLLDIQGPTRPDPDLDSAPSTARLGCTKIDALACAGASCWETRKVSIGGRLAVEGAESRSGSGLVGPWISNCGWVSTSGFVDISDVVNARLASAVAAATDLSLIHI